MERGEEREKEEGVRVRKISVKGSKGKGERKNACDREKKRLKKQRKEDRVRKQEEEHKN